MVVLLKLARGSPVETNKTNEMAKEMNEMGRVSIVKALINCIFIRTDNKKDTKTDNKTDNINIITSLSHQKNVRDEQLFLRA